MQGLGSGAIRLFGSDAQKAEWLPKVASGDAIAAFALTEPETGSDAANIAMTAREDGNGWVLDGEKSYISNGTIADVLTVFARTGEGDGAKGISAFIVRGDDPGLTVAERIEVIAPHPLARLKFDGVRAELLGEPGEGFRIAMADAEPVPGHRRRGGARLRPPRARRGRRLRDDPQARRRHACRPCSDAGKARRHGDRHRRLGPAHRPRRLAAGYAVTADNRRAAAMAKLHATEEAQKVIDAAVQMHGGLGVTKGAKVEELYREIRALRIYEGASEVQRLIIARDLLKEHRA